MRISRFNDEQKVRIIRETDRDDVPVVAKRHAVSVATLYAWKRRFGTLSVDDTRRLRALETENAKLKKLLGEKLLELEVMKEIAQKNGRRAGPSRAGGVRQRRGLSERRACTLLEVARSALGYCRAKAPSKDAPVSGWRELVGAVSALRLPADRGSSCGARAMPMSPRRCTPLVAAAKLQVLPEEAPAQARSRAGRPRPTAPNWHPNHVWATTSSSTGAPTASSSSA
jgi:putative transposase